jgi:hypothetical protein
MESDKLYRVQKEDLPKVEKMLNQCFAHDPLYETLIPDPEVRKNLMPELFKCDMDELYALTIVSVGSSNMPLKIAYTLMNLTNLNLSSMMNSLRKSR